MAIQAIHKYFYPRSPCGERRITDGSICFDSSISIHALLAESDTFMTFRHCTTYLFLSTLSLRRATEREYKHQANLPQFLSTLSLRRATVIEKTIAFYPPIFLSTLSLRRATKNTSIAGRITSISIHALLAESDISFSAGRESDTAFLSTLSLRRATGNIINSNCNLTHFYPRSPCGERLIPVMVRLTAQLFLSTLSLRRATVNGGDLLNSFGISIHALLAESDEVSNLDRWLAGLFLSTLSLRRATQHSEPDSGGMRFLSTLSLRRATVVGR